MSVATGGVRVEGAAIWHIVIAVLGRLFLKMFLRWVPLWEIFISLVSVFTNFFCFAIR